MKKEYNNMNEQRDGSNLNLMDENQEVSEPIKQINHVKFVYGKENREVLV